MSSYRKEFYLHVFRTILEKNKVCFIQTADQDRKRFMGMHLSPFDYLVVSEANNKNYIVEIVGNKFPKNKTDYSIDGRLKVAKSKRLDLEQTIIWQNIFTNFKSYIVFLYIIQNNEAKERFLKALPGIGEVYRYKVRGTFYWIGTAAIPSNDYLEYVNTEKIPKDDVHIKEKDITKILKKLSDLIPDVKPGA